MAILRCLAGVLGIVGILPQRTSVYMGNVIENLRGQQALVLQAGKDAYDDSGRRVTTRAPRK